MRHKHPPTCLLLLTGALAALVAASLISLAVHSHYDHRVLHVVSVRTAAGSSSRSAASRERPRALEQQQQQQAQEQQAQHQTQQQQAQQLLHQRQIPRILHVNYMAGPGQLLADALQPLSHFRKEWWLSCRTHHPGWRFVFWDAPACEALLQQRYPWFLPTWALFKNSTVLRSDAIRPFILHAHGGVYLDLDSECFSSMEPWLAGAHLVLQAEQGDTVNNAQMASVPALPLWQAFQRAIAARVAAGERHPLHTTGPHVLTAVVRAATGRKTGDLPGVFTVASAAPGSGSNTSGGAPATLVVYGPRQFFTPCAWDDWDCTVRVARQKPLLRAAGKRAAATAARSAQQQRQQQQAPLGSRQRQQPTPVPVMAGVTAVAGVHHFSGSWLGLDGSKSLSLRKEGFSGVVDFLTNASSFVEAPCQQLRLLPQPQDASPTAGRQQHHSHQQACVCGPAAIPVCWESVAADVAAGRCVVLSVRTLPDGWSVSPVASQLPQQQWWRRLQPQPHQQQAQMQGWQQQEASGSVSDESLQRWFGAEHALAEAGCRVHLVTDRPLQLVQPQQQSAGAGSVRGHPRVAGQFAALGLAADPFASPPVQTLDGLLRVINTTRLTLLFLDGHYPSSMCSSSGSGCSHAAAAGGDVGLTALGLMNQLYLGHSQQDTKQQSSSICNWCFPCDGRATASSLDGVGQLVLQVPLARDVDEQHQAFAMYQHLVQEQGFLGFFQARRPSGCTDHLYQLGFRRSG